MLGQLIPYCTITKDRFGGTERAYTLTFRFTQAVTTIRIVVNDISGADLAITHMTTLPKDQVQKGFGRTALKVVLEWALRNGLQDIRAVQVQSGSEGFWRKLGFVGIKNATHDFVYRRET